MILVDTSAWIDFFSGREGLAARVDAALESDDAAICGPVATGLRRGFKSTSERKKVLPLLDGCHWLAQPEDLWNEAGDIGFLLARRGATVKTLDLLIATYALSHSVPILSSDSDFDLIRQAGLGLQVLGS